MLKNQLFIILMGFAWLLSGCNQTATQTTASVSATPLLQTPVEGHMQLDSTVIGLSTIISGLNVPWEIIWGPDNWIWFTEQSGTVSKVNPATGEKKTLVKIPHVWRKTTSGLLGMALHPHMNRAPFVYVGYTTQTGKVYTSKLVRYTYAGDSLSKPLTLLVIPGSTGHNGARLTISPDLKLLWATGDAANIKNPQDPASLNGKVLRLNLDGSVPADNPVAGSLVWASGYRNMQGLVHGPHGNLYTSEHGDANDDEVNLIRKGANYGWPVVAGYCNTAHELAYCSTHAVTNPLKAWTPVIAPAGLDYYGSTAIPEWQNTLLLTTLKEADLRVIKLNAAGDTIVSEKIYFDQIFGRLRDICVSPAGDVYLATSNRDWNPRPGFPQANDDRILRIFPIRPGDRSRAVAGANQVRLPPVTDAAAGGLVLATGQALYTQYCAACHKPDGQGIAGTFPPLAGAGQVTGDKQALIRIVLQGMTGPIRVKGQVYDQQMPAFPFLSDQDLAGLLTYIRRAFGNKAGAVSPADISPVRAAVK